MFLYSDLFWFVNFESLFIKIWKKISDVFLYFLNSWRDFNTFIN